MASIVIVPLIVGGIALPILLTAVADFHRSIQSAPASASFREIADYLSEEYKDRENNPELDEEIKSVEDQIDQISSKSIEKTMKKFIDGTLPKHQREKVQKILLDFFFFLFKGKSTLTKQLIRTTKTHLWS